MSSPITIPAASLVEAARVVSFGLVVLIWLVQVIIYPAFAEITPSRFAAWHARYTRTITAIVGPLMFAQVGLMGALLLRRPRPAWVAASALVLVAWAATARLAVPLHDELQARGQDLDTIGRLVRINWVRTAAWTLVFLALCL